MPTAIYCRLIYPYMSLKHTSLGTHCTKVWQLFLLFAMHNVLKSAERSWQHPSFKLKVTLKLKVFLCSMERCNFWRMTIYGLPCQLWPLFQWLSLPPIVILLLEPLLTTACNSRLLYETLFQKLWYRTRLKLKPFLNSFQACFKNNYR